MKVLLAISDQPTATRVKRALKGDQLVVGESGHAQTVLAAAAGTCARSASGLTDDQRCSVHKTRGGGHTAAPFAHAERALHY
jgi:hypothetical protein